MHFQAPRIGSRLGEYRFVDRVKCSVHKSFATSIASQSPFHNPNLCVLILAPTPARIKTTETRTPHSGICIAVTL